MRFTPATLAACAAALLAASSGFAQNGAVSSASPLFSRHVEAVFSRAGCNSGTCHGAVQGKNGFRLSLLGFEPQEDYEHLVNEARGRRLFPAAPERSLLLLKATSALPGATTI